MGVDRVVPDNVILSPQEATAVPLREDLTTRAAYSGDASLYRRFPAAVLLPRNLTDLREAVTLARERGWALIPRGGGTSVAGNAIGTGLIVDQSAGYNAVLTIDPQAQTARVQPGVVCDRLNQAAAAHGLSYGPDPSTHSRCTIGGMVANNACGSHSIAWGTTADTLVEVGLLLPDGREVNAWRGGCSDPDIEAALHRVVERHEDLIRSELGRFPRQVSGYGLHHLLPERGFDIAKALAGSEGTCGIFTELTVRLVRPPAVRVLLVLAFDDILDAARTAPKLLGPNVLTLEGMGADLIDAFRAHPVGDIPQEVLDSLPAGGGWLYCEVGGDDLDQANATADRVAAEAAHHHGLSGHHLVTDAQRSRHLWRIRERAAGVATRRPDGDEAWPGWEDSAVPADRLADYLRDLYALMHSHGRQGIPFGHFGEGCVHIRIDFDLADRGGPAAYRAFAEAAADLVAGYGGSVSGEHGDGRARSGLLGRMYSPAMLELFAEFKAIFDPAGVMNPGVLVDPEALEVGLRPGPGLHRGSTPSAHAFGTDGGSFARAVTRCVGVGLCRTHSGSMCPSYQVTGEEVASTRGRARVLAEMIHGEHLTRAWRSPEVLDALDLCLSCKACLSECPVHVDMATYKSEFLHQHYRGRRRPLAHYSMGWLPLISATVAAVPGLAELANRCLALPPIARLAKRAAGIEPRRQMIRFAPMSLSAWYAERARRGQAPTPSATTPRLVLWPDTFTNYHSPLVGVAAVESLEVLGYRVELPSSPVCCGLTWHSTGQLDVTRRVLRHTITTLSSSKAPGSRLRRAFRRAAADDEVPRVVVLEPSCATMLREAPQLLPDEPAAVRLAERVVSLADAVLAHEGPWPFRTLNRRAVTQVHCHQRATTGFDADRIVLDRLGIEPDIVGGGCCGLAGNFGFEPGHWEVSQACAERGLYPAIRAADPDDLVLADGFSCRTQITQGTSTDALHLACLLRTALPRAGG